VSHGKPILWHIVVSHYSEKVRWALDFKSVEHERRAPLPGMHIPVALWLTRGRSATFPVLGLDGARIGDSTAIIAALEDRYPDPPLYPQDRAERRRALELEDWFDEELGPHMRRLVFHELRGDPERFTEVAAQAAPGVFARLGPAAGAYGRAFAGARYGARKADAAERSRERVVMALDRLEAELDGREYLVGEHFTVADLTAAALFYPLVYPPEATATIERMSEPYERFRASVSERPGYGWVQEMFRRHRRAAPAQLSGAYRTR
jgi:glutathione S-transferase